MKFNEKDIRAMVFESVRKLISEISVADAYQRFYSEKVPEHLYKLLMIGTETMTPYHKVVLDSYVKGDMADRDVIEAGELWAKASNDAKQYLVKVAKEDKEYLLTSPWALRKFITKVGQMKSHTENSFSERGLEVLYQGDGVLITCTKSYTASHKTYGDSHWCTASDLFGRYNGFEMFSRYTEEEEEILVQFINTADKERDSYQVGYSFYDLTEEEIFDWSDKSCDISMVEKMLLRYGIVYQDFVNTVLKPNARRLWKETMENLGDEWEYYGRRRRMREEKIAKKMSTEFNSKEFRDEVISKLKDCYLSGVEGKGTMCPFPHGVCTFKTEINTNECRAIIFDIEYGGYSDEERDMICYFFSPDDCDNYEDYITAFTQTWIVKPDFKTIIGIQQGCFEASKGNVIKVSSESMYGYCLALVYAPNGSVIVNSPRDVNFKRRDNIIEVWNNEEEGFLIDSITGKKVPGVPK